MLDPIQHARSPQAVSLYKSEPYVIAGDVYAFAPTPAAAAGAGTRAPLPGCTGSCWFLIMQIGRPVLIVPATDRARSFERFMIGWQDTRESRRAVVDALPLLERAVHVAVVEIAADEDLARARAHLADVVR